MHEFSGHGGGEAALGLGISLIIAGIVAIIALAILVFVIICWWKIFSKAGYSGALSLLMLVPFGELIMLCIMAFGKWPALNELTRLRESLNQPRQ
jgi:glycerol-3-phosphate acyltransferase PlsY